MAKPLEPSNLTGILAAIDRHFGIDRVLADEGKDLVDVYYDQSVAAYGVVHSREGGMHLNLSPTWDFDPEGILTQPRRVVDLARAMGASRILELGSGLGFNAIHVAHALPGARVTGCDLRAAHVAAATAKARAAGLVNLDFREAAHEALPADLTGTDLGFAVETLCYVRDPEAVARGIARALAPGGRFQIYDVHRFEPPEHVRPDMATAVRLYEIAMAVTHGFHPAGRWEAAFAAAGLRVVEVTDHSEAALPGLWRLQSIGRHALADWKRRAALRLAPTYLARNLIAGLLGPLVYRVHARHREGPLVYQGILVEKPAADV